MARGWCVLVCLLWCVALHGLVLPTRAQMPSAPSGTPSPSSIGTPTRTPSPSRSFVNHQWYISPTGQNTNSGMSSGSPFLDLRTALAHSQSGDIIHAAAGTYTGENNIGLHITDRTLIGVGPDTIFEGSAPSSLSLQGKSAEQVRALIHSPMTTKPEFIFYLTGSSQDLTSVQRLTVRNSNVLIIYDGVVVVNNIYGGGAQYGVYNKPQGVPTTHRLAVVDSLFNISVTIGVVVREDHWTISGCQFNSPVGMAITEGVLYREIHDTSFYGSSQNWAGIFFENFFAPSAHSHVAVENSRFQSFGGPGQLIVGVVNQLTGVRIEDNTCSDCAITVYTVSGAVVRNNEIPCLFQSADVQNSLFEGNIGPVICSGTANGCAFTNNYGSREGGALYWTPAKQCEFSGNQAIFGGAMYGYHAEDSVFFNNSAVYGGAICRGYASGSIFTSNRASLRGGAIFAVKDDYQSYRISDCVFDGNHAAQEGGAYAGCFDTITNCAFENNQAPLGGAVMFSSEDGCYGSRRLYNCSFLFNMASVGGGLYVSEEYTSPDITDSVFKSNLASDKGGAIYLSHIEQGSALMRGHYYENNTALWGGALYVSPNTSITSRQETYVANRAEKGGAIYASTGVVYSGQEAVFTDTSNFVNNTAGYGGALYLNMSYPWHDQHSTFYGNRAKYGGAVWVNQGSLQSGQSTFGSNLAAMGGAVLIRNTQASFTSCVFDNNLATNGTAVYCNDSAQTYQDCTFVSQSQLFDAQCYNCTTVGLDAPSDCPS